MSGLETVSGDEDLPEEFVPFSEMEQRFMQFAFEQKGPIPPAEALAKYNQAFPDGAQKVFNMALAEQAHRHKMDERHLSLVESELNSVMKANQAGLKYGFAISSLGLIVCLILGLGGQPEVAGVIGALDLVGLAGLFIYGKHHTAKQKQVPPPEESSD